MRFCIPIPCFFKDDDFCDAICKVKKLGFDAIETYNWKGLDFEKVKRTCEENGVEFLSMCTTEFRLNDPTFRSAWLDGLKESCEAAKRMNVGKLITQVGNDTGARFDFQHESIVAGLKAAKPILEEYGVTVMIEPLNTYFNHPGYYLSSSLEAFDIVCEVESPFVKVVYDIYHQQIMEGNIIVNVTGNLDCIAHLHCAGHPGRHELQFGELDYKVIFDAIDKAGYNGSCGLEYNPTMDSADSIESFKKIYLGI